MKSFLTLKSVDEIEQIIFAFPQLNSELVKLEECLGRYLAEDCMAPEDLPGFARSTMDGYAVIASDTFGATENNPAFLQVTGTCKMGQKPDFIIESGKAGEILTGAALPSGCDSVVRIEDCRIIDEGQIEIIRPVAAGSNIVDRDEDAATGEVVIPSGKQLLPPEIGILAAFGIREVLVRQTPTVAIISTGDEIIPIEKKPREAQLRDVNSWSIAAFCKMHRARTIQMGIVNDELQNLEKILLGATELADVIVVSGGSSAGVRDHTVESFMSLPDAKILVHGAAIRPGKPFIMGKSGKKCLIGLPGHVSSALVCAHVFLEPLLNHLQGQSHPRIRPWIEGTLTRSVAGAEGRRDYIRCELEGGPEGYLVRPVMRSSAVLRGLLAAEGMIICPENSEGLVKGQKVRFFPF